MLCSLEELRSKEVIDQTTGERLGFIDDVRLDTASSQVRGLVIFGRYRLFGLLGREPDIVVSCEDISVIGSEVILVRLSDSSISPKKYSRGLRSLFD